MNVDFKSLQFANNEWGQLVLTLPDGTRHAGVEPIRCFPLSDPDHLIAILDAEGRELINIPSVEVLNPDARGIVSRELTEREFVPSIRRIVVTSAPNPPCQWTVDTDRGQTSFQLESDDDIRRSGSGGAVVCDSNGIRYKIPDIGKLDASSQRTIRRLI